MGRNWIYDRQVMRNMSSTWKHYEHGGRSASAVEGDQGADPPYFGATDRTDLLVSPLTHLTQLTNAKETSRKP